MVALVACFTGLTARGGHFVEGGSDNVAIWRDARILSLMLRVLTAQKH
ncbi:MAG TPA: hypothetical protein VF573_24345 [Paraburkholderia sp.]